MTVPECIGIILDGNRRWAKERGVPALEGHREGAKRLKECLSWCIERNIKNLVVYAFSTENWSRPKEEVSYLMQLMQEVMIKEADDLQQKGIRTKFIGEKERFSPEMKKQITSMEAKSSGNEAVTLWMCLSYGGRAEIVAAAESLRLQEEPISEASIGAALWTAGMPDPDIIIRTGGRHRISNFLLWQSAYSEIFFLDTLWPDFSEKEFETVLADFSETKRTFGV